MPNKLKMRDAGRVVERAEPVNVKKEVYYQTIEVDHEDVPKLADKKVGEQCLVLHRSVVTGQRLHRYGDKKGKPYAELELQQIAGIPSSYDKGRATKMVNGVLAALEDYSN